MRIDEDATASTSSLADMPPAAAMFLTALKNAKTSSDFVAVLNRGRDTSQIMGKTELSRWVEVLNRCDQILEDAVSKNDRGQLKCDIDREIKRYTIAILKFTVLIFEITSSRRLFKSMDRILALMETTDMEVLSELLRVLQTMGKRSKYLSQRLCPSDLTTLTHNLIAIAQCWGGKLRGVPMAECVKPDAALPAIWPIVFNNSKGKTLYVDKPRQDESIAEVVDRYCGTGDVEDAASSTAQSPVARDDRYVLLSRIRMLVSFDILTHRMRCLIVRLLAVSTLIYCRAGEDTAVSPLLYNGFVEELVALLKSEKESVQQADGVAPALLDQMQQEVLCTLCSIVSLEKENKIQQILEALSAGSYHGFLSVMTRKVVEDLKLNNLNKPGKPSIGLSTALFSFIYHLASIEPGGETLVSSGLMQTLLSVISHHELPIELITFGTRCARIVDLFTTIDTVAFRNHNGMEICVNRIINEINECRKEQSFMIDVSGDETVFEDEVPPIVIEHNVDMEEANVGVLVENAPGSPMVTDAPVNVEAEVPPQDAQKDEAPVAVQAKKTPGGPWVKSPKTGLVCHQQRSGLIKGLLTFIKRAIQDAQFQESIRHLMEGGLPEALMHILSNADYYSPSLFHQSTTVITNFIYQEPDQLSALQRRHVPYVMLQSLLRKELPNSRDVIGQMGTVFTALCLNDRGLKQFKSYEPFDHIFRILLSVKFLVTMKKKRTEMTEIAQTIGTSLDDLLRNHPSLKPVMLKSITKVLDRLISIGHFAPENTEVVMALAKQIHKQMVIGGLHVLQNAQNSALVHSPNTATTSTSTSALTAGDSTSGQGVSVENASASVALEAVEERAEENMLVDEDEEGSDVDEEAEMSMDEMTSDVPTSAGDASITEESKKQEDECTEDDMGLDMSCEDGTGKRTLPLGDYMLIAIKIFETVMTQQSAVDMVDGFIEDDGVEKLLALCQLPCLSEQLASSSFSQSVANIIKFIVFQRNSRSAERLMKSVMDVFVRTMNPIREPPIDTATPEGISAGEAVDKASQTSKPLSYSMMVHMGEKGIIETLTGLQNIVPIMQVITKSTMTGQFGNEMRNRVFEMWCTPSGKKLHTAIRRVSRVLTWEAALIKVLKPNLRTCGTQTDPGELPVSDVPNPDAMETDATTPQHESTAVMAERGGPKVPHWALYGVSQEENAFWAHNKNASELVMKMNKSVSEMIVLLSRSVLYMSARRSRRNPEPLIMSEPAKKVGKIIFDSIYRDLKWTNPRGGGNTPMDYARLTELLAQLSTALFDDRGKQTNVGMMQKFYTSGCHKAFFELLEEKLVPALDGSVQVNLDEVLQEWCRLASRLVNKTNMMAAANSEEVRRHRIVFGTEFDMSKYLRLVYNDMFHGMKSLFCKLLSIEQQNLASHQVLCDLSMGVFREVVRNLAPNKDAAAQPNAENAGAGESSAAANAAPAAPAAAAGPPESEEQRQRLQSLVEMGFSNEQARVALDVTNGGVEEAAEMLLTLQDLPLPPLPVRNADRGNNDRSLEDVMRSLMEVRRDARRYEEVINDDIDGQEVMDLLDFLALPAALRENREFVPRSARERERREIDRALVNNQARGSNSPPTEEMDDETIVVPVIKPLKELTIEEGVSVQSACIQLIPLCKRLMRIGPDLVFSCADLMVSIVPAMDESWRKDQLIADILTQEIKLMAEEILNGHTEETVKTLATRIHFACLLFDHIAEEYLETAKENDLVGVMINLLSLVKEKFELTYLDTSLLPPVVLWLDLFDKNSRTVQRRKTLELVSKNLTWNYLADEDRLIGGSRTKKWTPYAALRQPQICSAFFAGKPSVTIKISTGRRDKEIEIDFTTMRQTDLSTNGVGSQRQSVKAELPENVEIDLPKIFEEERKQIFSPNESARLLLILIHLMANEDVPHVAAHSILSFVARLTKNSETAASFLAEGGLLAALRLKCSPSSSAQSLVAVIIRNCIDDAPVLSQVFEKSIRTATCAQSANVNDYLSMTAAQRPKEWHETLNKLASLISREPEAFVNGMEKAAKLGDKNNMMPVPADKDKANKTTFVPATNKRMYEVVSLLLREALNGEFAVPQLSPERVLTRSSILVFLAELVKSYPGVANMICGKEEENGYTTIYLLLHKYIDGVKDVEVMNSLKTLIALLAACNHSPKAQELLVQDIKATLVGISEIKSTDGSSLNTAEDKYTVEPIFKKLSNYLSPSSTTQAEAPPVANTSKSVSAKVNELCQIINAMVDACPAPANSATSSTNSHWRNQTNQPNHIIKLFHKKKICNDLVKTITFLQFSEKESIDTVNNVLKTLETLMKSAAPASSTPLAGTRAILRLPTTADGQLLQGTHRMHIQADPNDVRREHVAELIRDARNLALVIAGEANHIENDHFEAAVIQRLAEDGDPNADETREWAEDTQQEEDEDVEDSSEESDSEETITEEDENAEEPAVRDDGVETVEGAAQEQQQQQDQPMVENVAMNDTNETNDIERESEEGGEPIQEDEEDSQEGDDGDREEESADDGERDEREEESADDDGEEVEGDNTQDDDEDIRRQARDDDEEEEVDSIEEEVDFDDLMEDDYENMTDTVDQHRIFAGSSGFAHRHGGLFGGADPALDIFDDFDFMWGLTSGRGMPPFMERPFRMRTTDRELSGSSAVHPLLTRPPIFDEPSQNRRVNLPPWAPATSRYEFMREFNPNPAGGARQLHRQNAIRRAGGGLFGFGDEGAVVGGHRALRPVDMRRAAHEQRLADLTQGHGLAAFTSQGNRHSHFRSYLEGFYDSNEEVERRYRPVNVPSALERLNFYTNVMEPLSVRYLAILINTVVTRAAKKKAEEDKQKEEDAKKAASAAAAAQAQPAEQAQATQDQQVANVQNAEEEVVIATPAATATTTTISASTAPAATGNAASTSTVNYEHNPGVAESSQSGAVLQAGEIDVVTYPGANERDEEEPMEVGDDASLDSVQAPHSTAATAASSVAATEDLEDLRVPFEDTPIEDEPVAPINVDTIEQDSASPAAEERPVEVVAAAPNPADEYRDILGDIEIPEGVDPAFLAALPEDMRADVIRDYQRQQRAERASRPAAPAPEAPAAEGAPAVPAPTAAGAATAAADVPLAADGTPLVEPINPEFLQALPPELQEEVLQQHERAVREAQEALRRANAPPEPQPEMDAAAVIASLPANERTQVLAEMEETELARLPAAMQEEARRARATAFDPAIMRYHRLLFPGGTHARGRRGGPATNAQSGPAVGIMAGMTTTASTTTPQLLDKEAIMTLCMLYLSDSKILYQKLQKVLRSACANAQTCDFVIWCLLSLLEKATEASSDDEEILSLVPHWLESITVSGAGHNERAIRIGKSAGKVSINSILCVPLCKNILDLLVTIAKAYPGHFVPFALRNANAPRDQSGTTPTSATTPTASKIETAKQMPTSEQFWTMVQNMSKAPAAKEWTVPSSTQMEECWVAQLLMHLEKPIIEKTNSLQEKILKVASTIMQTLPNDSLAKLDVSDSYTPLQQHLKLVVNALTKGSCSAEGQNDGLTFIAESMRAYSTATGDIVFKHLFDAVQSLGLQLKPDIDRLIEQLDEVQSAPEGESSADAAPDQPTTSTSYASMVVETSGGGGRTARGRFDGNRLVIDGEQSNRLMMGALSCKELQLPAVTKLTDKSGSQYQLLSSLQTLVKVRNQLRNIRNDKKKREKEAAKKAKEAAAAAAVLETTGAATEATEQAANQPSTEPAPTQETTEPTAGPSSAPDNKGTETPVEEEPEEPRLSEKLKGLEELWDSLSECLLRLGKASDPHAVLALQPAAEAFFLVFASSQAHKKTDGEAGKRAQRGRTSTQDTPASVTASASHDAHSFLKDDMDPDTLKLIEFAEKHRQVLNQALRQNNAVLSSGGPFAILTKFPKLLDFDVKRKYFRKELEKSEPTIRYRRNDVSVQVRRNQVFSDSFRELFRLRPSDWKNRFYIIFMGEEGQDAGGLLREWFSVITREIFNPNYALFITAPGDMVTYMINKASYINPEHLDYFKFVGRLIAKAIYEHKYLDCYFTRAFYKHILNIPVKYQDLESEDPAFYKGLEFLLNNPIDDLGLDLTFSTEVEEFGKRSVRDLKPDGNSIEVNDANKDEYVKLVCQMKMTGSIRKQLDAFLQGFYEIIPKELISMFNEQELELLISGLPTVDIDDLAANTDYKTYTKTSVQIQWFWRALRSFEKEDKAKFLQFVTGTSKVPLQGFSTLEGMNGVQKFSIHMDSRGGDRLPAAHTCFNQLDLPQYESYDKLRDSLLLAIRECTEGFGFA